MGSVAAAVASQLEKNGVGKITKIMTDSALMPRKQRCCQLSVSVVSCTGSHCPAALRVLFLDIDGVLHRADGTSGLFKEDCMQRLKRIVDGVGATIVLSSSWRLIPMQLDR